MVKDLQLAESAVETPEVGKAEVSLVTDLMLALVKAAKGLRMYQENNQILEKFFQDLAEKFSTLLDQYGDCTLDVDKFELRYKGHQVYDNSDPKDSIAFRIYSDGLRCIIFRRGLEQSEITGFLQIVGGGSSATIDEDMVTQLWDSSFPHISYVLEEDYHEIDQEIDVQFNSRFENSDSSSRFPQELFSGASQLPPVPVHLLQLSEDQKSGIAAMISAEREVKPVEESARILGEILVSVAGTDLFSPFLDIYLRFVENIFLSGNVDIGLKMFSMLYRRAGSAQTEDERRIYAAALERFWSEGTVKALCRVIDSTDQVTADSMLALSRMVGSSTPAVLCEMLGLIEKNNMRKIVLGITTECARENPRFLTPFFNDNRWYLVRNVVFILAKLKDTTLLGQVAGLITHREIRVRKEVLRYFLVLPDPKAQLYVMKFLRDESGSMRIMAVQMMGRARMQIALKPLMEFVEAEVFEQFELNEKKAVYEAIAELGGDNALPLFKGMLTKKFHFQRARERDAVICAAHALQKIPGEATLKLLQDAVKAKTKDHHEVLGAAIKALSKQG